MKIRRFLGKDMREALNQVKAELGGDAVIMSNKKVAEGIEIVAAYEESAPAIKPQAQAPMNNVSPLDVARERVNQTAPAAQRTAPAASVKKATPSLSEIIGDSGPDSLKALLEKQAGHSEADAISEMQAPSAPVTAPAAKPQAAQAQPAAAPVAQESSNEKAIDELRQELQSLRNVLEFQVSGLMRQEQQRSHPLQAYLVNRLEGMGFSNELANEVVSYAPVDSDEREAWLFILRLLANRLRTNNNDILNETGVVAIVGSTGSGKTTTTAKLAARYAQKYGADQVALVTIDSYRIAAYEQLATYGKIIGCPVKKAANVEELSDVLHQFRNKRLVLIDTAGFGQRDSRLINQLDTLKQATCATIKNYLVLPANAQRQVLERTVAAYGKISLRGCIFTKLDECYSLGEVIGLAIQEQLAVSYLTDGQKVPEDLKVADAKYLISAAAKLYKKYGLPHNSLQSDKRSA